MTDQAHDLRRLVLEARIASAPRQRARLVVIAGGQPGVGATTLAVNLAAVLARSGRRTVLAEIEPGRPGIAALCGLPEQSALGDVLAGRQTLEASLQPGPAGAGVLPAAGGLGPEADTCTAVWDRLIDQFQHLGPAWATAVVDVGGSSGAVARRFWQAADLVLLVGAPGLSGVAAAYAAIKLLAGGSGVALRLVVNRATLQEAADVHGRLAWACLRFLGRSLPLAAHVPADPAAIAAAPLGHPLTLAWPQSPAARQIAALVDALPGRAARGPSFPASTDRENDRQGQNTAQESPAWGR